MSDTITTFSIKGLAQINRPVFPDDRGFFKEPVRIGELEEAAETDFHVVQMNHSRSVKNTLRGIHVAPWNKLIYVTRGVVQAVIVDLREDSETFGKHESFIIGEDNRSSIFVPAGCGNAYLVLSDDADYIYLTDRVYEPGREFGILWNDQDLHIEWKLEGEPLLSERDKKGETLREHFPTKFS